jgi:hypothetical protein
MKMRVRCYESSLLFFAAMSIKVIACEDQFSHFNKGTVTAESNNT